MTVVIRFIQTIYGQPIMYIIRSYDYRVFHPMVFGLVDNRITGVREVLL